MTMTRIIAIMACGLGLASCSSATWSPSFGWSPSFDAFSSKPATTSLTIESEPPGAEARTPQGQTCRTPCSLIVPVAEDLSVSYALNGYAPQAVTVHSVTPKGSSFLPDSISSGTPTLEPNPVFVMLSPTTAPKPAAAPKKKKRPAAAAAAQAAPGQPTAQAQPSLQSPYPPPPGGFTPVR
jgi:hypothetical protein